MQYITIITFFIYETIYIYINAKPAIYPPPPPKKNIFYVSHLKNIADFLTVYAYSRYCSIDVNAVYNDILSILFTHLGLR